VSESYEIPAQHDRARHDVAFRYIITRKLLDYVANLTMGIQNPHTEDLIEYTVTFCSVRLPTDGMGIRLNNAVFWDITLCSPLKVNGRFGRTYHLDLQARRIGQETDKHEASIRQSKAICSSETSVDFELTTRRYMP
jgi:hypothetical protein